VWRAKLCGGIGGEARWQLALDGGEARLFRKLVDLGCGAAVTIEGGLGGMMAVGLMADRYQVEAVQGAVEDAVLKLMTVDSCGMLLACSSGSGLVRVELASRELALREFDEFARTAGFMEVGEEVLGSLLEDDELMSGREELVFEGVVRWMKGGNGGDIRGSELLRKVRFPLMEGEYLAALSREQSGELTGLAELVGEALGLERVARDDRGSLQLKHLHSSALMERKGVRWQDYVGGGERRIDVGKEVACIAADGGYVCGGLFDGSIMVWSKSTLRLERTLTGHEGAVVALLFVGGRLVSGCDDNYIRAWDVAAGLCQGVLEGFRGRLTSLVACGSRLVCGGFDRKVRVWVMEGAPSSWRCERLLDGPEAYVTCMVAWGDKVACGSGEGDVLVWSSETWALERTLPGHGGYVFGLAVHGRRLICCSEDGTVRVWSTETWECVQAAEAYPAGSSKYIHRVAVCGPTLVGGSCSDSSDRCDVRVWDLETLRPLHTLVKSRRASVCALLYDGREVWGALGDQLLVWGRPR
jgi:hypothetical protein